MARLTDKEREQVVSDWKMGDSQNHLAKKYNCSPATINKLCKGVVQDSKEIVNTQMAVNRALSGKSEYEVNSIADKVNRQMFHEGLINDNATKLANKLSLMADQIEDAQDMKHLVEANDKLSITLKVNDRHAPKIDVTQQLGIRSDKETVVNIIEDKAVNE